MTASQLHLFTQLAGDASSMLPMGPGFTRGRIFTRDGRILQVTIQPADMENIWEI
jgi:acyl-CoA thioesterase